MIRVRPSARTATPAGPLATTLAGPLTTVLAGVLTTTLTGVVATVLAGVLAVAAAGCATGSGPDDGSRSSTHLDIGVVPVIDVAPLYLGIDRGFFREQRLTITPKPSQAGATITAAVVAGQMGIGFSNNTSLLVAASQGLPLRIVAAGNQASDGDYAVIFARAGGQIHTPADLAGRRIAVNNRNNVGPLSVNAALEASGVDISGITFVEIPFPQMGASLAQGQVDAVWAVEPFVSAIKSAGGATPVLRTYPLIGAHFPVASYFTSRKFADGHAGVIDRFRQAMNRSLQYAQGHPDEARAVLPHYIQLAPEVAARVELPEWGTDLGLPLLRRTAELAQRYGYLTRQPDVAGLVHR